MKVTISDEGSKVVIKVENNGLGISQKHQDRVFLMFQRFHPMAAYGSGLGMYIVKKHVNSMNAENNFTSMTGKTIFSVSIPKNNMGAT